ncbi:MAG: tol-pal system protein YbgF [Pseudomonadota bacterium]
MKKLNMVLMTALLAVGPVGQLQAQSVEQRLERVERIIDSESLLEMLQRIESLESEVQQLRGQLEEQQHAMEGVKGRQRELYLDLDRRLSRIEREGVPSAGTAAPSDSGGDSSPKASPESVAQEREAYQKAFDTLRELRYAEATEAFRAFLAEYPDGRYAHIAQYWLGEAGYAQRKFEQAIEDYRALLRNHPDSPKRAEAMLKIGYSHHELKQTEQASTILKRLIEQHPDSTEAGQARNLLRQIRSQDN